MNEPKPYTPEELTSMKAEAELLQAEMGVLKAKFDIDAYNQALDSIKKLGTEVEELTRKLAIAEHEVFLSGSDCRKWRDININLLMQNVELSNETVGFKAEIKAQNAMIKDFIEYGDSLAENYEKYYFKTVGESDSFKKYSPPSVRDWYQFRARIEHEEQGESQS